MKTKLNVPIDVSFHPTPAPIQHPTVLSTVLENEVSESISIKDIDLISSSGLEIEPIEDQIFSVSSATNVPIDDPNADVDVSIIYDHVENKILFEINEKSSDSVALIDLDASSIMQPDTNQSATIEKCDSFLEEYLDEIEGARSQYELIVKSEKWLEATVSSTTMVDSPQVVGKVKDERERTPIGKLIFRRLTPACIFDQTQYAVEMIDRIQRPMEMLSPPSSSPTNCCTTPKPHRVLRSTAMASKADKSTPRFSYSPRIILRRVDSLQDYYRQCGVSKDDKTPTSATAKRRGHGTNRARSKCK